MRQAANGGQSTSVAQFRYCLGKWRCATLRAVPRWFHIVLLSGWASVVSADPITVRHGQSSCGSYFPHHYEYPCYPGLTYGWEYRENLFELSAQAVMARGPANE